MRRSGASGSKSENTDSLADHVRGHRRTITELSGLLGTYRKQGDMTSVFTSSERDSLLFGMVYLLTEFIPANLTFRSS
jgi:hypothetical protein